MTAPSQQAGGDAYDGAEAEGRVYNVGGVRGGGHS